MVQTGGVPRTAAYCQAGRGAHGSMNAPAPTMHKLGAWPAPLVRLLPRLGWQRQGDGSSPAV